MESNIIVATKLIISALDSIENFERDPKKSKIDQIQLKKDQKRQKSIEFFDWLQLFWSISTIFDLSTFRSDFNQ